MDDEPSPNPHKITLWISIFILIFLSTVVGEIPNNIKTINIIQEDRFTDYGLIDQLIVSNRTSGGQSKKAYHIWSDNFFRTDLVPYRKWERVYQIGRALTLQERLCPIVQEINAPPLSI